MPAVAIASSMPTCCGCGIAVHSARARLFGAAGRRRRVIVTLPAHFDGSQRSHTSNLHFSRQFSETRRPNHAEIPTSRHQVLTLLHKTSSFLPRTLAPNGQAHEPYGSLEFSERLLSAVHDELSSGVGNTRARVTVYSVDEWSGGQQLLTALLDDPFAADGAQSDVVRTRWKTPDYHGSLIIEGKYPSDTQNNDPSNTLRISSSWLQRFPIPIQITELASSSSPTIYTAPDPPPTITRRIDELEAIYKADVPIILFNPLTTPLSSVLREASSLPLNNPNSIIVLTASGSSSLSRELVSRIQKLVSPCTSPSTHSSPSHQIDRQSLSRSPTILFIDPRRALTALQALKSNPSSSLAVQRYQDDFVGSNISSLTDALSEILAVPQDSTTQEALTTLRIRTAIACIRGALCESRTSFIHARNEMDAICLHIADLKGEIAEAAAKAHLQVFGTGEENVVKKALKDAEKDMKVVMDEGLSWWKVVGLGRVDDVSDVVGSAVEKVWCRELERKLILQTGRLSALQEHLTASTFSYTSSILPSSYFHSPVLLNTLHQLSSPSSTYRLSPETLTSPLYARRTQLLAFSTPRLHRAAQRATAVAAGSIFGGAGMAMYGVIGTGIGLGGTGAEVVVSAGVLGALVGVRWAVGAWERGKRRWWEDWGRVGEGLERDLKETLDRTTNEKVAVVVEGVAKGFGELADRRKEEIEELEDELQGLEEELGKLEERVQ